MMPSCGYLLCSIQRTGSTLLADALAGTRAAGLPLEYFNPVERRNPWMLDILGDSNLVEGLPKILIAGTTPNSVFGAKVHWNHFRHLGMSIKGEWDDSQRLALYDLLQSRLPQLLSPVEAGQLLRASFPDQPVMTSAYSRLRSLLPNLRIIWLRRQNMVARAVSHFRARRTGLWYQPLSTSLDGKVCDFDLAEIHNLYCLGSYEEQSWQQFFGQHEITPFCVFYEELVARYEITVRRILGFLGVADEQGIIPPPRSMKQSDALSEQWEERYRNLGAVPGGRSGWTMRSG